MMKLTIDKALSFFLILLCLLSSDFAFSSPSAGSYFLPPKAQKSFSEINFNYHPQRTDSMGNQTQLYQANVSGRILLTRSENDFWALGIDLEQTAMDTSLRFPGSNLPMPHRIYDLKVTGEYAYHGENKNIYGARLTLGTLGDEIFTGESLTIGATGFMSIPASENASFLFFLNYSNNRALLNQIPLPGFAYHYQPSKTFSLMLGAPFLSVFAMPVKKLILLAYYIVPYRLNLKAMYFLLGPIRVYLGLSYSNNVLLRANRIDKDKKIFYDRVLAYFGVASPISRSTSLDFSVGHAFNRKLFESIRYSRRPDGDLSIPAGIEFKLSIKNRF